MLDTLSPFIEKNSKNVLPVAKPTPSTSSNSNESGATDAPLKGRAPSYDNPNAVKGTDGVIYRAAGARGKGKGSVPIVAPTVVAPGCVTTATLDPIEHVPKKENSGFFGNGLQNVKKECNTSNNSNVVPIIGSNNGQFKSLDEIRAKFPMSSLASTPNNNNVIRAVEKKMQDPWENPSKSKGTKEKQVITSPENGNRLLYDPKRRRGRPLDIPDQTIILAPPTTPKAECTTPPGFKQV